MSIRRVLAWDGNVAILDVDGDYHVHIMGVLPDASDDVEYHCCSVEEALVTFEEELTGVILMEGGTIMKQLPVIHTDIATKLANLGITLEPAGDIVIVKGSLESVASEAADVLDAIPFYTLSMDGNDLVLIPDDSIEDDPGMFPPQDVRDEVYEILDKEDTTMTTEQKEAILLLVEQGTLTLEDATRLLNPSKPTEDIVENQEEFLEEGGVEKFDEESTKPVTYADRLRTIIARIQGRRGSLKGTVETLCSVAIAMDKKKQLTDAQMVWIEHKAAEYDVLYSQGESAKEGDPRYEKFVALHNQIAAFITAHDPNTGIKKVTAKPAPKVTVPKTEPNVPNQPKETTVNKKTDTLTLTEEQAAALAKEVLAKMGVKIVADAAGPVESTTAAQKTAVVLDATGRGIAKVATTIGSGTAKAAKGSRRFLGDVKSTMKVLRENRKNM